MYVNVMNYTMERYISVLGAQSIANVACVSRVIKALFFQN